MNLRYIKYLLLCCLFLRRDGPLRSWKSEEVLLKVLHGADERKRQIPKRNQCFPQCIAALHTDDWLNFAKYRKSLCESRLSAERELSFSRVSGGFYCCVCRVSIVCLLSLLCFCFLSVVSSFATGTTSLRPL